VREVRVAAHVHSCWSYDADWSLPDIARAFRRRRYDVVLMSEHDRGFDDRRWTDYKRACADASTDDILLIPGIEYEDADNVVHTPVWGDHVSFLGAARPTLELLRAARSEDAVAVFAHPWRRDAILRYQPEWAPLLSAVEIWNRRYDGIAPSRKMRDFAEREGLAAFASLDFHTSRQFFPLAMSTSLADRPTASAIVEAVRAGTCRPELLGLSALRFTRGLEGVTLQALETVRRRVRGQLRRVRQRVGH
jgi:predicted metal-dependent phosphoesterase TrpH